MALSTSSNRHFTPEARAAALAARRLKAALPKGGGFEVFAVRSIRSDKNFNWEVRRFGGVVMRRGTDDFPSVREALRAGERHLANGDVER